MELASMNIKYQMLAVGFIAFALIFLQPAYAFSCLDNDSNYYQTKGLASTPQLNRDLKKTDAGKCVIDPKATFAPYKIPSYADLKSVYFDQSKSTRKSTLSSNANQGNITDSIGNDATTELDRLIYVNGSVTITGNGFLNAKPVIPIIIFTNNDLTINNNIDFAHNSSNGGLVFVVGGNVNIHKDVTQIDAVIIAQGNIYTAGSGCSHSSPVSSQPLTVNGSLITLADDKTVKFCRKLDNNSEPAEKIIHQPKYLVILRNLMSDTLQKWSEIQ